MNPKYVIKDMISILIPVYNTNVEYLIECMNSIDSQTYQDFEVVIVDDGSTDSNTIDYLSQLGNKPKYKVIHLEKNMGLPKALNIGLEQCSFEIVARMDGDDIMLPTRLELQLEHFLRYNYDVLGTQIEIFGDFNKTTSHPLSFDKRIVGESEWFMNHPTIMYKRSKILKLGYNEDLAGALEDYELWCNCLLHDYKIGNMADILVMHRKHNQSVTETNNMGKILSKLREIRYQYGNKYEEQLRREQ